MRPTSRRRKRRSSSRKAELDGVPEDFLKQIKTGDDEYTVMANITWHYLTMMDNARREETRKQIYIAHSNLAKEENVPLLEKILPLRDDIAKKLGYKTWADYETEVKMVKTAATAIKFLETLKAGLQPKFDAELEEFRQTQGQGDRRCERADQRLGLALLQQPVEEGEIQRGCRATARVFPVSARARWDVQHLPEHLRPEVRAGRAAVQMDRRPAALCRVRRANWRAARLVLPRHVPAGRQVQSLRAVRHH